MTRENSSIMMREKGSIVSKGKRFNRDTGEGIQSGQVKGIK